MAYPATHQGGGNGFIARCVTRLFVTKETRCEQRAVDVAESGQRLCAKTAAHGISNEQRAGERGRCDHDTERNGDVHTPVVPQAAIDQ